MTHRSVCLVLVALIGLWGCSGSDVARGDRATLEGMLGLVPDTGSNRQYLVYGNLARLRDGESSGDAEADMRTLFEASRGSFMVASPVRDRVNQEGWSDEAGFVLPDIDASLEAGQPPDVLSVFTGRLDGERIDGALTGTAPFADEVEESERNGLVTYAVGAEGELDVNSLSLLRPIGQSLRIGVEAGTMWLASTDGGLERALDTAAGDGPALADDEEYVAVARALDEAGAFNAALVGDPTQLGADLAGMLGTRATPEQVAEVREQLDAGTLGLAPWQLAGLADAPGELVVVLSHADDAAAQDNAERLRRTVEEGTSFVSRRPWSEHLSVSSIEADGRLMVARLASDVPMAFQILTNRDSLIMIGS